MGYGHVYSGKDRTCIRYSISITENEMVKLKQCEQDRNMQHCDFVKAALEEYAGMKIFRERDQKYRPSNQGA